MKLPELNLQTIDRVIERHGKTELPFEAQKKKNHPKPSLALRKNRSLLSCAAI